MTPVEQLDAWRVWYEAASNSLRRVQRLGAKYWDDLPWDGRLGKDNLLGHLEHEDVTKEATLALTRLDELALMELFSIFEGVVRLLVAEQLREAARGLIHPMLKAAAKGAVDAAERRSFAEILNSYSQGGHADLAEQVRQVRRYRNWLSHGRRGKQLNKIEPKTAYQRLRLFLELLLRSAAAGGTTPTTPDAIS